MSPPLATWLGLHSRPATTLLRLASPFSSLPLPHRQRRRARRDSFATPFHASARACCASPRTLCALTRLLPALQLMASSPGASRSCATSRRCEGMQHSVLHSVSSEGSAARLHAFEFSAGRLCRRRPACSCSRARPRAPRFAAPSTALLSRSPHCWSAGHMGVRANLPPIASQGLPPRRGLRRRVEGRERPALRVARTESRFTSRLGLSRGAGGPRVPPRAHRAATLGGGGALTRQRAPARPSLPPATQQNAAAPLHF